MAPIDSLLNLVDRQGANELRLGTEREPQMFADGAQKRLVIPKTSAETLRELLGELLSEEREKQIAEQGSLHPVGPPRGHVTAGALPRRSGAKEADFNRGSAGGGQ